MLRFRHLSCFICIILLLAKPWLILMLSALFQKEGAVYNVQCEFCDEVGHLERECKSLEKDTN